MEIAMNRVDKNYFNEYKNIQHIAQTMQHMLTKNA